MRQNSMDVANPASSNHTTWAYNADDTVQKVTDARGAVTTYSYNSRHLVTNITYSLLPGVPTTGASGVTLAAAATYGYDAASNRTSMSDGLACQGVPSPLKALLLFGSQREG